MRNAQQLERAYGTPARLARLEGVLRRELDLAEDRLMILDLGPADSAAERLKSINSITDLVELGGAVL